MQALVASCGNRSLWPDKVRRPRESCFPILGFGGGEQPAETVPSILDNHDSLWHAEPVS